MRAGGQTRRWNAGSLELIDIKQVHGSHADGAHDDLLVAGNNRRRKQQVGIEGTVFIRPLTGGPQRIEKAVDKLVMTVVEFVLPPFPLSPRP